MCVSRRGSGVAEEKMAPELPVTVLVQGELPKGLLLREFAYDFFFSSRRRHTRLQGDWSSDGALPISGADSPRVKSVASRASLLSGSLTPATSWGIGHASGAAARTPLPANSRRVAIFSPPLL